MPISSLLRHLPETERLRVQGALACLRHTRSSLRLPVRKITAGAPSDAPLNALAYGWTESEDYLLELLFGEGYSASMQGRELLPHILRASSARNHALYDMILCPVNPWTIPLFRKRGWHILATWVDCIVPVHPSAGETLKRISRTLRQEIRAAQESGLRIEANSDPQRLRFFFEEMLKPTIQARHARHGFEPHYRELEAILKSGSLLCAFQGDEWIAGGVVGFRPQEAWFAKMGWLQGEQAILQSNVVNLMFREVIEMAGERGLARVNFGGSRGLTEDGVLRYKMKWRAVPEVRRFQYNGQELWGPIGDLLAAHFRPDSPAIQALLHRQPMLAVSGTGMEALSWNRSRPAIFDHLQDRLKWTDFAATSSPADATGSDALASISPDSNVH
jgi:hypothetical protein